MIEGSVMEAISGDKMVTKTKITPAIIKALKEASEAAGSQMELSKKSEVNQPTLNMIANGKTKSITSSNWKKLLPFLSPFLNASNKSVVQIGNHNTNTINAGCEAVIIDKILKSDLTADEKVKFIEVVRK